MAKLKTLNHGMLLRAKNVMDDAMCELEALKVLIPPCLHKKADEIIAGFEDTLCSADVSDQYRIRKGHDDGD